MEREKFELARRRRRLLFARDREKGSVSLLLSRMERNAVQNAFYATYIASPFWRPPQFGFFGNKALRVTERGSVLLAFQISGAWVEMKCGVRLIYVQQGGGGSGACDGPKLGGECAASSGEKNPLQTSLEHRSNYQFCPSPSSFYFPALGRRERPTY